MKKILFLIVTILIALSACSKSVKKANVKISDGDLVLVTKGDKKLIDKNNLISFIASNSNVSFTNMTVLSIFNDIFSLENIEADSEMVEKRIAEIKENGLEAYYLQSTGVNSIEQLKEIQLNNSKYLELAKKHVNEEFDEITKFKVIKVVYNSFDTKEEADNALANLNEAEAKIILNDDSLESDELKAALFASEKNDSAVFSDTSKEPNKYYAYKIISTDVNEFKDEFINYYSSTKVNSQVLLAKYAKKYNLTIHNEDLYQTLKNSIGEESISK